MPEFLTGRGGTADTPGFVPLNKPRDGTPVTRKPVAIFVCHGMGQQVPFETIEMVVNALLREQGCREPSARPTKLAARLMARPPRAVTGSVAELAPFGGGRVVRGRLDLQDGTIKREVHVYEGYWAPLTEGKIGVWGVFAFLLGAARLGIWSCLRHGGFVRFMFGKKEVFTGRHLASLLLLASLTYFILLLLVGPVVIADTFALATALWYLFGKAAGVSISHPFITALTWYVARIEIFILGVGVAVLILPKLYSWALRQALILRATGWLIRGLCFVLAMGSLAGAGIVAGYALASVISYAVQHAKGTPLASLILKVPWMSAPAFHFFKVLLRSSFGYVADVTGIPYHALRIGMVWATALAFGYFVRWFLVQFAGDVAIYTSGYKVSVFEEVRDKIRKTVLEAASSVYQASDQSSGSWLYDHVILVGHSLGSDIAYDTLNSLLTADSLRVNPVNVAGRTNFFLTFGSPLDKIAFIFSTHSTKTDDFREKAAEEIQPLIRDWSNRPGGWVNIWSPMDIISGRLRYYDDLDKHQGGKKRVANKCDKNAWVPFAAHTEYWQDPLMAQELYNAILRTP